MIDKVYNYVSRVSQMKNRNRTRTVMHKGDESLTEPKGLKHFVKFYDSFRLGVIYALSIRKFILDA